MIKRLRLRMTLVVIGILILVSAGIIFAFHLSSERSIADRAEAALAFIAERNGAGLQDRTSPPDGTDRIPPPDETEDRIPPPDDAEDLIPPPDDAADREGRRDDDSSSGRGNRRHLTEIRNFRDAAAAGLGNTYSITLNQDGSVASWTSARTDLYSDEQVREVAADIMEDGRESGRIGTQFFRVLTVEDQTRLLVFDARLEFLSASGSLRSAVLITGASCLLLALLAWLLIRRMVRPVEEAFIRQKQFVSDASHELKTPLAVISANAEVLEQEIGKNEYLGYIRSEVRRTDSLVRNLLTLARLDRNEKQAEMKPFDLSHALLDVVLPFESTVFEAGKTLETDIPDGIRVTGNEEMIKQLAVILLSNALKYSEEGGQIRISLSAKGRQREIRVFNTGTPIAPEDREKIFDRFWRADPAHSSETGGHGLGLAIARSIVNAHRGKIYVDSPDNKSTVFTVLLND